MAEIAEKQAQINAVTARIAMLKARLKDIPQEVAQLELAQRELRTKAVETAKRLQAEQKIAESRAHLAGAHEELRGISRNIIKKREEQAQIAAEIEKLEKELKKLLK